MTDRQTFLRTFKYVRPYMIPYIIGIILYCSQNFVFPLINAIVLGRVTQNILDGDFALVINTVWLMLGLMVVFMILLGVGVYMHVTSCVYALRDLRMKVFRVFMKSSIENEKHSGEGIASINTDTSVTAHIFDDALAPFLMSAMAVLFSCITIFIIDWRMGLGALAVGAIVFIAQSRFAAPLAKLGKDRLEANADSVKAMSNIFAGALTIRAFSRQREALISFDKENGRLKKIAFKQAFIGMWQDVFGTVQGWLTTVLVFALGGWFVANGTLEFSHLLTIFIMAMTVGEAMSSIGAHYARLHPPIVAARRVFEILDSVPEIDNVTHSATETWNGDHHIKLQKLTFAYKNADRNALDNVELEIAKNQMVAFVGESGSGKSTLLRAIIGMYEREDLNMQIGNMPFTAANLYNWRKCFAYVDQTCKLFDMTIAQNIAMGNQGNATTEEITAAARRAFADEFVTALPDGYNTNCGEKGASLSGGQKQRLAIARALCRKAPVLVFDEATSALDAESERNVMQTIETLRTDHTILITTHNLHNIKTADKIVVMENGAVAEVGTHEELVAKGGVYARLLEEQNAI